MQWYYAKHGKQEGPVDLATLQGMLQSGQVAPTDLVWREGMAEWTAVQKVPELLPPAPAPVTPLGGGIPPQAAAVPQSPAMSGSVPAQQIPNYLVQAILVTVLCCVPFGIPAIIFAAKVDGLVARGDMAGAMEASRKAKMWTWIAAGSGFVVILLYVILMVVATANGQM